MQIKRDRYLNKLIAQQNNGMIKIISGIRRCGKSYLLEVLFTSHLLANGVNSDHIINIRLDELDDAKYRDPFVCNDFVKSKIQDKEQYYLMIDEVQLMDRFVEVLNGFLRIPNLDVYVTGSNSKFLSSDIVTEFRGRGSEIRVYPLSFAEFYSAVGGDWNLAWNQYYMYGGMPQVLNFKSDIEKRQYLKNLVKETYLKDIIERNKIKNVSELEELLNILASNIGGLTNIKKLADTFNSIKHLGISIPTVKQYIDYFMDAFIISKAMRYDIKGRKYINTPVKYYFADMGLRNAQLDFRQQEENHIMENVLYNELNICGYQVDVGNVTVSQKVKDNTYTKANLEVDFVANMGDKRCYVQSALNVNTAEKLVQEERSLIGINDSFRKIIVVRDDIISYQTNNGTTIMSLKDFLLNSDSILV